jgi:hypothetical protein
MAPREPAPAAPDLTVPGTASSVPRLLSRRQLLQAAASLGALVVLGALPSEAEGATLPALTAARLTGAMAALPKSGPVRLPGGGTAQVADLRAAGAAFAVGDASSPDPASNPVAALGVLVALAAWAEHDGTLNLSVALPKAPVRPLRLALPHLPGNTSTETLPGAIPPALVVRPKASLVLVGTLSGHRVLAALEDPARSVAGHPRLELVLLHSVDLAALLAVGVQQTRGRPAIARRGVRGTRRASWMSATVRRRPSRSLRSRCLTWPRAPLRAAGASRHGRRMPKPTQRC